LVVGHKLRVGVGELVLNELIDIDLFSFRS